MKISERQLVKLKIDSLKFDKTNPNKLTDEQMQALQKSMQRFGYLTPIVVDQDNLIADGEHRALIYKQHGLEEIPAFKVELKTDAERRMLRQTMNKLRGEHDRELDANELVTIFRAGQLDDLTQLIAQDKQDLQRLMLRYHPALDFVTAENEAEIDKLIDDELKRAVPDARLGDVYELGQHKIICSDASSPKSKRIIQEASPDMILTDPPYSSGGIANSSIGRRGNPHIERDGLSARGYMALMFEVIEGINADVLYMFTDWRMWSNTSDVAERLGFPVRNMLVWDKMSMGMGGPWRSQHELILFGSKTSGDITGRHGNVLQCKRAQEAQHFTQKPVDLLAQILSNTKSGAVYDPFMGSGSTLIACEQQGRNFYGMDIDPHYCDITIKRWEMYTGKKAVKIEAS